jgi:hypothetical protein
MKELVTIFKDQTSEFNVFGIIATLSILAFIFGCAGAVVVGLIVQGEPTILGS